MPDLYLELDSAEHFGEHHLADIHVDSEILSILTRWAGGVDFEINLHGAGEMFTYHSSEIAAVTFRR